ncbi:hypothetical protein D3C77_436210 [compost metagenome]
MIRNFRNYDLLLAAAQCFDFRFGSNIYAASPGFVSVINAFFSHNDTACRKIRALHISADFLQAHAWLLHYGDTGIDHLAQIMRRNFRSKSGGNTADPINEQVRIAGRQDDWLHRRIVEIIFKRNRPLLNIAQKLHGDG